jgi:hypothetical protein
MNVSMEDYPLVAFGDFPRYELLHFKVQRLRRSVDLVRAG